MRTIEVIEQDLETALKELHKHEKQVASLRKELLDAKLNNMSDSDNIVEKFTAWAESDTASNEEPWIVHIKSSSGKELFGYDQLFHCERHQTVTLEEAEECLLSLYKQLNEDDKVLSWDKRVLCTRQDLHDWMQGLMDIDFKSMVYDW